jgi:hypothetical protein
MNMIKGNYYAMFEALTAVLMKIAAFGVGRGVDWHPGRLETPSIVISAEEAEPCSSKKKMCVWFMIV